MDAAASALMHITLLFPSSAPGRRKLQCPSAIFVRACGRQTTMAEQPFIKYFVILKLIAIIVSLATAFRSLFRDKGEGTGTVKALTIRVGLSIVLFIILMVLASLGIIKPH